MKSGLLRHEVLEYLDLTQDELDEHLTALLKEDLAPGERARLRDRLDRWADLMPRSPWTAAR
ncbi:MAG TPA: hypothetical protein VN238_20475 [Solirubrobacteraceae bacterium]|nr:hypothetical protein [Solirubrobacteraceae bacterium]